MGRTARSLSQRISDAEKREAIALVTPTERLLALILLEMMEVRRHRDLGERSQALARAGFSKAQVAALLDTSVATLRVLQSRGLGKSADAVDADEDR